MFFIRKSMFLSSMGEEEGRRRGKKERGELPNV